MRIDLTNGRHLFVTFHYEFFNPENNWQIYADIDLTENDKGGMTTRKGWARRNLVDCPNRLIGRKLALARALNLLELEKADRTLVWSGLLARGFRLAAKSPNQMSQKKP